MKRLAAAHTQQHADASFCYPEAGHNITFGGGPTTTSMWRAIEGSWYALVARRPESRTRSATPTTGCARCSMRR